LRLLDRAAPQRGRRQNAWLVCAALLSFAFVAPARSEEWYEDYQDGLKALARGEAKRAAGLFERAIQKRPEPGVNLPTYGTNFERRYFPYLRLAEARLRTGEVAAAGAALDRSEKLQKEPADERALLRARLAAALEQQKPKPPPAQPTATPTLPHSPDPPEPTASASAAPAPQATPSARPTPEIASAPTTMPARREPTLVTVPAARPDITSLEVYSQPPGALVYLDDEFLGRTDPQSGRLQKGVVAPGRHRVRFSLAGHVDLIQELEIRAGIAASFRGALTPAAADRAAPPSRSSAPLAALAITAFVLVAFWALRRRPDPRPEPSLPAAVTPLPRRQTPVPLTPSRRRDATPPPGLERTPDPQENQPVPFGEYTLLSRLGRGGMAAVYKAERAGALYALKRPLADHLEDPQFLERFLREAEIGRSLHHPSIVRIYERGQVGNVPYFAMELVPGETLQALLRREAQLEPHAAARLVAQVAEALDYAHNKGVVHRDLKPSNIMVLPDGTAKVMDYGIARAQRLLGLTTTGDFLGTPDYVAPEIVEAGASDARSDLYSLGIVFFEAVTGGLPFSGDTAFAVLSKRCTEEPPPPSARRAGLPPEVDAMIVRLLRKEPAERYATAEELLADLGAFLGRH